jgi:hypothetical protein
VSSCVCLPASLCFSICLLNVKRRLNCYGKSNANLNMIPCIPFVCFDDHRQESSQYHWFMICNICITSLHAHNTNCLNIQNFDIKFEVVLYLFIIH